MEQEYEPCIYCNTEYTDDYVPDVGDDAEWERLASHHGVDCEWIATRAHRVNQALQHKGGQHD